MNRSKIRPLGLGLIVLGLMAFGATAAQAEPKAKWLLAEAAPGTNLRFPSKKQKMRSRKRHAARSAH